MPELQRRKQAVASPVILAKQQTQTIPSPKPGTGQIIPPQNKTIIGLNHPHQTPQILTGSVASPPLKAQAHFASQQPIVTGRFFIGFPKYYLLIFQCFY
jgi:hypothetical protein